MKSCPQCGVDNGDAALECHACGIVFARYGQHKLRRPARKRAGIGVLLVALLSVVVVVAVTNTEVATTVTGIIEQDTADTAEDTGAEPTETAAEPARVAGAELVLVPTQEDGRWYADVFLTATDNKAQPTTIDGEAVLRWGLVQANQHRETVILGEWLDTELPHAPGVSILHTRLHRIPFDPDTARGMPLRVEVEVAGLRVEGTTTL